MTQMPPPRGHPHPHTGILWKKKLKKLADFTLNQTWPIFYDYIPVYKIWIQYTNLFKKYWKQNIFQKISNETIFQCWKRAVTPKIISAFYPKSNLTYIL